MGIQYGSNESIVKFPEGLGGTVGVTEVAVGDGVEIGVGVGAGSGLVVDVGVGVGVGVGLEIVSVVLVGSGDNSLINTPLFQTVFFPDLMQVNFFPL